MKTRAPSRSIVLWDCKAVTLMTAIFFVTVATTHMVSGIVYARATAGLPRGVGIASGLQP